MTMMMPVRASDADRPVPRHELGLDQPVPVRYAIGELCWWTIRHRRIPRRMALQLPRHKFTSDEYQQLGRLGIFTEDDRVELLDGDIVEMSPLGPRHVRSVNRLTMMLAPRLVGQAIVQVQSSLKLDVHWEPEPDVAVLRLREDDYVSGLPTGADVLLLIEVMDSSRGYDRVKLPAYARSGIPEVWLLDLEDQVLLSHRQPVGAEYRLVQARRIGESITPQALPDHTFGLESILG